MKTKSHLRFYTSLLLSSALAIGGSFSLAKPSLAAGTAAGTVITNTATGSFDGETSGTSGTATSNTVSLSVLEVAGITVVPLGTPTEATLGEVALDVAATPGPYQNQQGINNRDIVYYDFTITNTGNSPTAIFIPDIATIGGTGGGIQRRIKVIAVDPDGASATNASIPVGVVTGGITVPTGGGITTDVGFLGVNNGYIPVNGTVTVRVAVEISGVQVGDTTTVILGDTGANDNTAGTQNQDYVASTGPANRDVFTSDLPDGTALQYSGVAGVDQTLETNGEPVNGADTVPPTGVRRKEASALLSASIANAIDYGDAPTTGPGPIYGTLLNAAGGYAGSGPSHIINSATIRIGNAQVVDAEANGLPTATADGDDTNGNTPDDEVSATTPGSGGITLPAFDINQTTYTATVNVNNTTGADAYLVGWIDFDRDGTFQDSEAVVYDATPGGNINPIPTGTTNSNVTLQWTLPVGLSAGDRYARFRLTTDINVIGNSVVTPNPQPLTPLGIGEVEDYILGKVPGFNLVKRITAITDSITSTTTQITGFVNGPDVIGNNDSDPKWPTANTQYLRGAIDCTTAAPCNGGTISGAKPGDIVEYTIYFLSNGSDNIRNVQFCDRIPANTTFVPNSYGAASGILFGWDNTIGTLPNPNDSTLVANNKVALTNASDGPADTGEFVPSATALPAIPCGGTTTNPNGALLLNFGPPATVVPAATGSGLPIRSYGFVRFRVQVN